MESDSSAEFLGALRFNSADRMASKIQCMTARNNMCIKALLITSIYSIVKLRYYSLLSEFLLTQKTCFICSSISCIHSLKKSQHRRTGNFLPGGAVNHLPKKISQVAQIFTKESKRNEGHITTT